MKIILLIPIYNDRESLTKLIENINFEIEGANSEISIVVINDASSQQIIDKYKNTENINSIEIINMKENRGHARCIASGLKYIFEKKEFDYVIPMDGDGEDRPEEKMLNEKATWNSFSGSLKKVEKNLLSIPSMRGTRYFGPSKMSFINLLKHSLSIISVFRKTVLIIGSNKELLKKLLLKRNIKMIQRV